MEAMYSSVERERSVSSIRRMKAPPCRRANAQLKSAVRAPPMWRCPAGLGANRTRPVPGIPAHGTRGARRRRRGPDPATEEAAEDPAVVRLRLADPPERHAAAGVEDGGEGVALEDGVE